MDVRFCEGRNHRPSAQGALLQTVRDSTARFKDVSVAESEGYSLLFGCVTGPDAGAMGLHHVNMALVGSGVVDATKPQIVIYEPQPDGHLHWWLRVLSPFSYSPSRFPFVFLPS
jgi:hypothetical protein